LERSFFPRLEAFVYNLNSKVDPFLEILTGEKEVKPFDTLMKNIFPQGKDDSFQRL
jgi:hypothetical protein